MKPEQIVGKVRAVRGGGVSARVDGEPVLVGSDRFLRESGVDPVVATTEGLAAAPSDPLPTGRALYEHWLGQLETGARKMLEILYDAYPNGVDASEACTFFPNHPAPVCHKAPARERVTRLSPHSVRFEDPPGVKGDGDPSGGQFPADGVLTARPGTKTRRPPTARAASR